MSNIDKRALAITKELAVLMVERFSMNPVSCKLLNESWEKEFPDEVAIAKRMLALLDELEAVQKTSAARLGAIDTTHKMFQGERARAEAAEKRIGELEEKQRLIDICQGQGLEHRISAEKRAEAAEKRIADYQELISGLVGVSSSILREVERINNAAAAGKGEAS